VPTQFVAGPLRDAIATNGKVNVRIWELALAFAVRDALRSGNPDRRASGNLATFS
jgi:hypothetical protein